MHDDSRAPARAADSERWTARGDARDTARRSERRPARAGESGMADPDAKAWQQMLAHLRRTHPAIGRQWFDELDFLGIGGGVLRVRAHSAVHRDYLQRQCADAFNEAAQAITGRL